MRTNYARNLTTRKTTNVPQTRPLKGQVANSAGGYSFAVDCWTRLDRFLILGCEGGSYYATERELTVENAKCVMECAIKDVIRTVERIVQISTEGRAPKNDPAIFALALMAGQTCDDSLEPITQCALEALNKVCRTGEHLFQFVEYVTHFRGWGRKLRTAIANWYKDKDADRLAYQVTKYGQRNGWSHRDLLRLTHAVPTTPGHKDVFQYIAKKEKWLASTRPGTRMLVMAEEAKTASVSKLMKLIREEGLVREHIPTERLNDAGVWAALLENMPVTAMVRNLNKMTNIGLLAPLSDGANTVCQRLRDQDLLRSGRVHPYNLLVALKTYSRGQGMLGDTTWKPVPEVVAALEDAFYLSFGTIVPTGKRHLFGIDVSGSMGTNYITAGKDKKTGKPIPTPVQCRSAAACLAMLGMRIEPRSYAFGFTSSFQELNITANDRLLDVERKVYYSNFGTTDCAVPMTHALRNKLEVDAFVVLTDNETYAGSKHPTVALEEYRQRMGIDAKLIVVGMVSNGFTIADPNDPRQMDVVGFDSSAPSVMADFVREEGSKRNWAA